MKMIYFLKNLCLKHIMCIYARKKMKFRIISSPFWLLEMSVVLLDTRLNVTHSNAILSIQTETVIASKRLVNLWHDILLKLCIKRRILEISEIFRMDRLEWSFIRIGYHYEKQTYDEIYHFNKWILIMNWAY